MADTVTLSQYSVHITYGSLGGRCQPTVCAHGMIMRILQDLGQWAADWISAILLSIRLRIPQALHEHYTGSKLRFMRGGCYCMS